MGEHKRKIRAAPKPVTLLDRLGDAVGPGWTKPECTCGMALVKNLEQHDPMCNRRLLVEAWLELLGHFVVENSVNSNQRPERTQGELRG